MDNVVFCDVKKIEDYEKDPSNWETLYEFIPTKEIVSPVWGPFCNGKEFVSFFRNEELVIEAVLSSNLKKCFVTIQP